MKLANLFITCFCALFVSFTRDSFIAIELVLLLCTEVLLLCTEDDNSCYRNVCKMTVLLNTEHLGFLALNKGLTNQFAIQKDATAAIGEPEHANKAHNMSAGKNRDHTHDHLSLRVHFTPFAYACNSLPATRS